jgi:hypothetical protein
MSARLNRRGATLPLTMIVIALMAVAVAISFYRISSERNITGDGQAQLDAFNVAQSGLSTYLANLNGKPGWTDNATINGLPGGTAQVNLRMIRESTTTLLPAVYVITARGTNTTAKRYGVLAPSAERTVATYALWTPAPLDLDAAITTLGGMDKAGGSGTMNGNDACGAMPAIGGVAVPTAGYSGSTGPIDGNPDNTPVDLGSGGASGAAKDEVDIDWAGIVAGTMLPPNFTYPSWPTATEFLNWPVVRVNNHPGAEFDLPDNGKGILIVTGNVILSGSRNWEGIILAGGSIRSNGSNSTRGAVIAGLNLKLGEIPPVSQMNGTKSYQYDSCALTRALGKIGSIQRVPNGWTDTWSSW